MKKTLLSLFLLLVLLLTACGTTRPTVPDCSHTDGDDNGFCDSCKHSVMITIEFYTVNDLHGKLSDGDSHPGVDELTTFLKTRQDSTNVVLLSAGDMWQGAAESNLTQGMIITDWMNALDFAAMTLGNHEFDWGESTIEANAAAADFPFLAINILDRDTGKRVDYCQASTVVDIAGIQIGIIGAMGDCYSSIAADKVEDVYFATGDALTQLVKAEAQRLRTESGADFIVYILHDGYGSSTSSSLVDGNRLDSYYDTELSDGFVDLVFEGHTHQRYLFRDEYGVYHLQHRGDNAGGISCAKLHINTITGTFAVADATLIATDSYDSLDDDPIVEQLLEKYQEDIAIADRVLGNNSRFRSSDALCDLVADLYYQLGLSQWGDAYPITLGGGFLSTRSPYELEPGQVAYGQLQALFPFDNDIVLCSVRGQDLLDKFIYSSNSRYHISGSWDTIDPNGTYYIVVDSYTATYAPNRLTIVAEYTAGIYARDLLAEYIENGGLE